MSNETHSKKQIQFCDEIEILKTIGSNVIIGIILQNRITKLFAQSFEKATEYISKADAWYIYDIIGERVFRHALLNHTEKAISKMTQLAQHLSN